MEQWLSGHTSSLSVKTCYLVQEPDDEKTPVETQPGPRVEPRSSPRIFPVVEPPRGPPISEHDPLALALAAQREAEQYTKMQIATWLLAATQPQSDHQEPQFKLEEFPMILCL